MVHNLYTKITLKTEQKKNITNLENREQKLITSNTSYENHNLMVSQNMHFENQKKKQKLQNQKNQLMFNDKIIP